MSVKNVKNFFEKLELDKELQEKLKALEKKCDIQNKVIVKELIAIASDAGYNFTVDDFIAARENATKEASVTELQPIGTLKTCGPFDLVFSAPCTCGHTSPCNSTGLA